MTIRKQLFCSNLLMVGILLIAFIVVSFIFSQIMENVFSPGFNENTIADKSLLEIQEIVDNSDANLLVDNSEAQNNFMNKLEGKGFHLIAEQNGKTLFANIDRTEQSYVSKYIVSDRLQTANQTLWIRKIDVNILWHSVETDGAPIVFIAVGSNQMPLFGTMGVSSAATVSPFLVLIVALLFIVITISLILSGKVVKKIILPIDNLCEGAERIQDGNFDEDIYCDGIAELTKVCDSFNEMQHQLKANIKKNEIYEQDRKEMLAGISHDLRTPLASIKSYAKGLRDDIAKTPEKQSEYLDVVYRKACGIECLINQLFLFSKLEIGDMPFDFHRVSIQNYIVTFLDSAEYDLKKTGATLTMNSTCSHQEALLDTVQMTRAITNILENSVKYNPGKQIHIEVTLTPQNGKINIRIQDDGLGVSKSQLPRLFDRFYRGDESRNNSKEGSGLGLAIAKNIVKAHGGSIVAESYNGLTVMIELPVVREDMQ